MINEKINIKKILNTSFYFYQKFHRKTKLFSTPKNELMPYELPDFLKKIYYKSYPRMPEIKLPKPKIKNISIGQALRQRVSSRTFSPEIVSLKNISALLYYSAGINKNHTRDSSSRFYPSGGKKYPLETYILSFNTELERGLYHYYVPNHTLEFLTSIDTFPFKKAFTKYNQSWISKSSFLIINTAIFERTRIQYGERSYRLIHLEAGHMGQNIYLCSSSLGINCCGIAGIVDSFFEELLDIDGIQESVIYTHALGTKD